MLVDLTPAQLHYLEFLEAHKTKEETAIFITQNKAYKRFGRGNVDRWAANSKIKVFKRKRTIEYRLRELLAAAECRREL